jgi:hypothetical protein
MTSIATRTIAVKNINRQLAEDPFFLEVFCDYLEENLPHLGLHVFLRYHQHEERSLSYGTQKQQEGTIYGDPAGNGVGGGLGCFMWGDGNGSGNGHADLLGGHISGIGSYSLYSLPRWLIGVGDEGDELNSNHGLSPLRD